MPFPIVGAGFFLATQGVEEDPQMQPLVLAQLMAKIGEVVFCLATLNQSWIYLFIINIYINIDIHYIYNSVCIYVNLSDRYIRTRF
jgi:hypothetical protein